MQEKMRIEHKKQPRICPFQLHRLCYNIVKKIKLNSNLCNIIFLYCTILYKLQHTKLLFIPVLFVFFLFFYFFFFYQIWIHFPVVQENVIQVEPVL